jgi:predicted O-linked N-acetylglucosamine transferase (SPINDLY family)
MSDHLLKQAAELQCRGDLEGAERLCLRLLSAEPDHFGALQILGFLRYQQGRFAEALASLGAALKGNPGSPVLLLNYAVVLDASGRHDEAVAMYDRALAVKPDYADAWFNRGVALRALKRPADALWSFEKMLEVTPDDADALNNRGNVLRDLKRPTEALESFERALAARPNDPTTLNNRGNVLRELNRIDEAIASYDQALAIQPNFVEALLNCGSALLALKRPAEALPRFNRALAIRPNDADALIHRGEALSDLKRPAEALESFERALAARPNDAGVLNKRGIALNDLHRYAEALASIERALAIEPKNTVALINLGYTLFSLKRLPEALASFDEALAIKPDDALAYAGRGNVLRALSRPIEALASFERSVELGNPDAFWGIADQTLHLCDWERTAAITAELENSAKRKLLLPFESLGYSDDPALHLECAKGFIESQMPVATEPLWKGGDRRHDKLRIAYVSQDFYDHATSRLIAELIELHDRSRFEVSAISYGHDDGSEMRVRLIKAFDRFHNVGTDSDLEVAKLINALEIDIAVDLKGYTMGARPGILSYRPAPIQVSFLGYPGTMGCDFIDYVIADETVLPFSQQRFYPERIVHLPDCYQPNDRKRAITQMSLTRPQAGLPEDGFVFCCFNDNYKITPAVFDVWMRLLNAVPGSVLWLLRSNAGAEVNLCAAAEARGISASRLVFAERMRLSDHLARHRLADLFLDTLPVNAHTTTSDALWAGLPVLTCLGTGFAGRVAASLVKAAGLPELISESLADYEAAALRLAKDAASLHALRRKLAQNKSTCALFDTDRYRRHIEAAYSTMWNICQNGVPQSFAVAPLGCVFVAAD